MESAPAPFERSGADTEGLEPSMPEAEYKQCCYCGATFAKRYEAKRWAKMRFCSRQCAGKAEGGRPPGERHSLRDRFESKVNRDPGQGRDGNCHEWLAGTHPKGYGLLKVYGEGMRYAHRVAWFLETGDWPGDVDVCHTCDNPPCVRFDHLFVGTRSDNMRDCWEKGRHAWQLKTQQHSAP